MRNTPFRFAGPLALALVCGLAAPGWSEEACGRLQTVLTDQTSFVMTDEAGFEQTFRLSDDARLEINGEEKSLSDLNEGDEVTVIWEEVNGEQIATIVNVLRD